MFALQFTTSIGEGCASVSTSDHAATRTVELKTDDSEQDSARPPPHILFVVGDDIGWNNVGWNAQANAARTEVSTPELDRLARDGIQLTRTYAFKYCSPTRCSIQSGRNPIHVQVGNAVFGTGGGIPANMSCLANKLKQRGYRTIAAGKCKRAHPVYLAC